MSKKSERGKEESLRQLLDIFASDNFPEVITEATVIQQQELGIPCENWSLGNRMIMLSNNTTGARIASHPPGGP